MAFGSLKGSLRANAASITNPFAATGSVAVVVGDLIYAVLGQQTALTVTTLSDNLGNVYTAPNAGTDAGTSTGRPYYSRVTVAGTLTSVSATTTASANNVAFLVAVIEGPVAIGPPSANPANITSDNTSPFTCPSTGTLSQKNEIVIGWQVGTGSTATSATSPNLAVTQESTASILHVIIGYQAVTETTAVSPAFTAASNPSDSVLGTSSFKQANLVVLARPKPAYPLLQRGDSLARGLVGAWTFSEGSGTKIRDHSGSGNDGTFVNSPTWTGNAYGSALSFNGSNASITAPIRKIDFSGRNSFSVSVLANLIANPAYYGRIVSTEVTDDLTGFEIAVDPVFYTLYVRRSTSATQFQADLPQSNVDTANENIITFTYDGTLMSLYVNGRLVGGPLTDTNSASQHGTNFYIGANHSGNNYLGKIGGVLVWNRGLSSNEVREHRADFFSVFRRSPLYLLYPAASGSSGTGSLASQVSVVAGNGVSIATGAGILGAQAAALTSVGVSASAGTGSLSAQTCSIAGIGAATSVGTGALLDSASALVGVGAVSSAGTGVLTTQTGATAGVGISESTGNGTPVAQASNITGIGESLSTGTGALVAQSSTVNGAGLSFSVGTGILGAQFSNIAGIGTSESTGYGTLVVSASVITSSGISSLTGSGTLSVQSSNITGDGLSSSSGNGILAAQPAAVAGAGISSSTSSSSNIAAQSSTIDGIGDITGGIVTGTGTLVVQLSIIDGTGISASTGYGTFNDTASVVVGAGVSYSVGSGTLSAQSSNVNGIGLSYSTGVGSLAIQSVIITGTGVSSSVGSASLVVQTGAVDGTGDVTSGVVTGTGTLVSQAGVIIGAGVSNSVGSGVLNSQSSTIEGFGYSQSIGIGLISSEVGLLNGVGISSSAGIGLLVDSASAIDSSGVSESVGFGALVAANSNIASSGTSESVGYGNLISGSSVVFGTEIAIVTGTGQLQVASSSISGAFEWSFDKIYARKVPLTRFNRKAPFTRFNQKIPRKSYNIKIAA